LYRAADSNRIRYVGRGLRPDRATQHSGGSHNPGLQQLIDSGRYTVEIAGPYADPDQARLVEAALISALRLDSDQARLTNRTSGDGPEFAPLGVPGSYADRSLLPALTVAEVGRISGGALIVRNSFGPDLEAGRPRLDAMTQQQDDVIVDNIVKYWLLDRVADSWREHPETKPHVLVGAAGPPRRRYVPGALFIDRARLGDEPVREVPIIETPGLDAVELRGRLLLDARFAQGRVRHFLWVDGDGVVRYPPN
jgi:hypothetical protein